jgi:3-oxoacyl-[acyl-carrier protein] reductase
MDFGLQDRVAVVTGAASGIGQACARALADEGCRVLVSDIQEDGLRELEAEDADKYVPFVADLSTGFGPKSIVDAAISEFDRLDVLVTAGGIFGTAKGGLFGSDGGASVISVEEWDRTLNINLRGTFLVAQEAIPRMAENGWGRIVTIGSVSGQMGGFEAGADYIASKAGVAGVTRALALDAGPKGITVNTVNPGMIETPMLAENVEGGSSQSVAERSAVRRLGTRDELAAMVVMLCSEQAAFVTGSHVDANGGFYFG